MENKLQYNPAYSGTKDAICATLVYHNQWSSFKPSLDDGSTAPITQTFNIHGRYDINQSGTNAIGLGLTTVNDNLGFEHTFGFSGVGSFHHRVKDIDISAGLSVGYAQVDLKPKWFAKDPADPRLPASISDKVIDLGTGIYVSSSKFYAGASFLHINEPKLTWTKGGESKYVRSMYFTGGYNYLVPNSKFEIQPGILVKYEKKAQFDLHAVAMYNQKFYGGLNYHTGDALSLLLGVVALSTSKGSLKVGYSYDLTTQGPRAFGGKHEIYATYCFRLNLISKGPMYYVDPLFL